MVKISTVRVAAADGVVSEFEATKNLPKPGDLVWVPDNGDVAYFILGRRFDYKDGVVTLNCQRNDELKKG